MRHHTDRFRRFRVEKFRRRTMAPPSRWFNSGELNEFCQLVQPGDLLEFGRHSYFHWAIYVGPNLVDGIEEFHCVIHRCVPSNNQSKNFLVASKSSSKKKTRDLGSIAIESLLSVLDNDRVRINNQLDEMWPPFTGGEIVVNATNFMNADPQEPYNLISNNCEHFVNLCRYGRRYSRQIHSGSKKVVSTVAGLTLTTAIRAGAPIIAATLAPQLGAAVIAGATAVSTALSVIPPILHAVKAHQRKG